MCFTPTVMAEFCSWGFHLMTNILSLCPRAEASFSPFFQSHTCIQWLSSNPMEASFFPSAVKMKHYLCHKTQWTMCPNMLNNQQNKTHQKHKLLWPVEIFFWIYWWLRFFINRKKICDDGKLLDTKSIKFYYRYCSERCLNLTLYFAVWDKLPEKSTAQTPLWCAPLRIARVFSVSTSHTWTSGTLPTCPVAT